MSPLTDLVLDAFARQLQEVDAEAPGLLDEALALRAYEAKESGSETSAEDIVGREAAMAILAPVLWARQLGSTIDTTEVVKSLGISRQAVALRIRHRSLLALPGRRSRRYPSWQFGGPDGVWPIVPTILRRWYQAEPEVEPKTIALWANTPVLLGDGDEVSPAELIVQGGKSDDLVQRLLDDIITRRTQ